jgi:hypothetical protein
MYEAYIKKYIKNQAIQKIHKINTSAHKKENYLEIRCSN